MILVTGGAGYIGSHTCVALLEAGHSVVVYDNFSNSHPEVLHRMEQITGKTTRLVQGDIRDQKALEKTMRNNDCEADVAVSYADPSLAAEMLKWKAERNLADMCRDHWRWQESFSSGIE